MPFLLWMIVVIEGMFGLWGSYLGFCCFCLQVYYQMSGILILLLWLGIHYKYSGHGRNSAREVFGSTTPEPSGNAWLLHSWGAVLGHIQLQNCSPLPNVRACCKCVRAIAQRSQSSTKKEIGRRETHCWDDKGLQHAWWKAFWRKANLRHSSLVGLFMCACTHTHTK